MSTRGEKYPSITQASPCAAHLGGQDCETLKVFVVVCVDFMCWQDSIWLFFVIPKAAALCLLCFPRSPVSVIVKVLSPMTANMMSVYYQTVFISTTSHDSRVFYLHIYYKYY